MRQFKFKRKANRVLAFVLPWGWLTVATKEDDEPRFISDLPQRPGDLAIIEAEGQRRKVLLFKGPSSQHYLIDRGPA